MLYIAATHKLLFLFVSQEESDGGSKEKFLMKWKGQKLVRVSDWDIFKSSLCLIEWRHTGTGFIGKKGDNVYLVTCWHVLEVGEPDTANDILKTAQQCKLDFGYIDEKDEPLWSCEGEALLQEKQPVGNRVCMPSRFVVIEYVCIWL